MRPKTTSYVQAVKRAIQDAIYYNNPYWLDRWARHMTTLYRKNIREY